MKSPYVNELEPNQVITTSFLVHSKEIRQKKSGELYLSLLLGDRTGELDAKMWDNVAEVIDGFDRDDFVKVKGLIQVFHNRPQLTIHKVRRMDDSEIDFADYFPSRGAIPARCGANCGRLWPASRNPHLKALLEALLDDPKIAAALPPRARRQADPSRFPGRADRARAFAVRAGAHDGAALSQCRLRPAAHRRGAARYRQDLRAELRARIFVLQRRPVARPHHDRRCAWWRTSCAGLPDFPPTLRSLVEHMILSHHGQLEFGSPKLPQFPEALLLHYLDDMDSKMECMRALIENDRQVEGCFTTYNTALERAALKKDRYLNGEATTVARPVTVAATNGAARETEKPSAPVAARVEVPAPAPVAAAAVPAPASVAAPPAIPPASVAPVSAPVSVAPVSAPASVTAPPAVPPASVAPVSAPAPVTVPRPLRLRPLQRREAFPLPRPLQRRQPLCQRLRALQPRRPSPRRRLLRRRPLQCRPSPRSTLYSRPSPTRRLPTN